MEPGVSGMVENSAGNTLNDATHHCPKCSAPWYLFLPCKVCGYDEGTPV